ncbi:MAG: MFS transporter [Alistipes sp.]|nr:MFS transporter [Candidatus Alistipes equi]
MTTTKSYNHWEWRTIIVTMAGYAMFYLLRKNFTLAMPGLTAEFGVSNTTLGIFLTLHGVIYGLSRYVVGIITDRNSARKILALGLMLCSIMNILFGTSDLMTGWLLSIAGKAGSAAAFATAIGYIMGVLWMINGFLQGMGVPPCTKILTQWIHPSELATKMSIWNMSHSIGAGLAVALCGYVIMPHLGLDMSANQEVVNSIATNLGVDVTDPKIAQFASNVGAWRWCFLIPAMVGIVGSIWLYFVVKDSPSDAGFPELEGRKKAQVTTPEEAQEHKDFVNKHVYRNRVIWTLAVTNLFVYVVRFGALDWGAKILMEDKGMTFAMATTIVLLFEMVGGNLGMLFWGWATDRFFQSKAHHTCVVCMAGVAASVLIYWFLPLSTPWWVLMLPYMLIGFCIYGPQGLLGICAAQHATNRASATANGILGIFGYLSTIISGFGFGFIADRFGWNGVYVAMFVASVIGILIIASIWSAKATGYENENI